MTRTGYRHGHRRTTGRSGDLWLAIGGPLLLCVSKLADAVTTAVGLLYVPGVREANPIVVAVIDALGVVPGLLVMSVAAVVAVTAVTEAGALLVARRAETGLGGPRLVRLTGYVPLTVLFAAIAVHNATIIAAGV